ncbi:ABC transporter ATP-binding protein [Enorma sp.]|uniref:ABC transporter ATP-binding protein n=1 Tax=Enorma sp. TaxID=1920692 RepID=UPI0025C40964|nr:ABC transporter ATP-binding protein [Enorma sp.]
MAEQVSTNNQEYAIEVNDVTMVFNMASAKLNSLKEYFIALAHHELFFKEFKALKNISFKVPKGSVVGLVGTNGSGKSTMLKIIAGVLDPTEGSCVVRGNIAPLIELGAGFDRELTARENIYLNGSLLGYTKTFIEEHIQEIIDFAELADFMDMPLKNYSSGMTARIAFAIATVTEPDILIVDETLSVGDVFFQEKCMNRIRKFIDSGNVTVLFVSHNIKQVEELCQTAVWIEKGVKRMEGPVEEVCEAYRNQFNKK